MSRIGGLESSGIEIEASVPDGNEHLLRIIGTQLAVDELEDFGGAVAHHGDVLDEDLGYHHEECRGNALARDIGHYDSQMLFVDKEEIIEVASDLLRGVHGSIDVEIFALGESREDVGQGLCLYPGRHVEFMVDTVLLELLLLIPLDLYPDYHVTQVGCCYYGNEDDELDLGKSHLKAYRGKRRCQIYPECGSKTLVKLGSVSQEQEDVL